ncbi:MAG: glutamine amidotransferase, partial [Planctomycetota bacterium]
MLIQGTLVLGGGDWVWVATLLLVVGVGVLLWGYSRVPENTPGRVWGLYLKMAGLVLLALCLVDPMWSGEGAKKGANVFVVAVDNSRSMTIRDGAGGETRGEGVRAALVADGGAWQDKLGEDFRLRRYVFDTRLKRVTGFDELDFTGRASSLSGVMGALGERYAGQPLAGVLLVTDGGATDLSEGTLGVESLAGVPVYPVVVGVGGVERDLAIGEVTVSETSFEDSPVTIKAEVRARGYRGEKVIVDLLNEKDVSVFREEREVYSDDELLAVRHRMRAEEGGVSFYRLEVTEPSKTAGLLPGDVLEAATAGAEEGAGGGESDADDEATAENNARVLKVERDRGPYRILYVAGRPNWEYKYLRRATEFDPELDLAGLIRIAEKEPRFEFRGRGGEANNPLFRGYDKNDPDAEESYDESVYVHMNMEEGELSRGFARTELELFEYDAVIFDDVDAAFFTHDQMSLVEKFVSERGGGLLMLGGQESFEAGGFNRTPIGQLLPVYLDPVTAGVDGLGPSAPRGMRLDLTREGWLAPWARLRDTEASERDRLDQMPGFKVVNRARAIKPGASVIATVSDGAGESWPGLVVQRFGRGRAGALMVGDLWKW